jgi:guanylate kinase
MEEFPRLSFSVSYTTRPPRPTEKNGVDYVFVDDEAFQKMVDDDQFAEWAHVHGFRYGTTRATVEAALEEGRDVLFDIDWQGGRQLKAWYSFEALMVWILPPSLAILEERLRARATDAPEVIERRLQGAKAELLQYSLYDYLVVNESLDSAYDQIRAIYIAAKQEIRRASRDAEVLVSQVRDSSRRS